MLATPCGETGLKWFPLDPNDGQRPSTTQNDAHLARHGELIFDEVIVWVDGDEIPAQKRDVIIPLSKAPETPITERIKAMLSEHMGVRPELIEVDVRVKF
jgi:hypothetical protein